MNLSDLRYAQFNSPIARSVLSHFYKPGTFPKIAFGPLKGSRFYYDRTVNYHAVLGLWEPHAFEVLQKLQTSGHLAGADGTVADVGGNLGYYTLWLAKRAVPRGKVYAFEPNPKIADILQSNLDANGCGQVEIVRQACGDRAGTVDFFAATLHGRSSLHESYSKVSTKLTVPMTALDAFFGPQSGRTPPSFMKMDIEGGGNFALPGAASLISKARPLILIESHTHDEDRAISNVLLANDYDAFRLNTNRWVAKRDCIHGDADGVWGTMLLVPKERRGAIETAIG